MAKTFGFIGKHWLTLGLLVLSVVAVEWIVRTQRAPGSMTVIEAQAMDMTSTKPPPGVQPVAVEEVTMRRVGGTATFPATVLALSDEDVVARVAGRVSKVLVYAGDRVRAGQLLAVLDADELGDQAKEASLMATAKGHMALGTEHDIAEQAAMLGRARSTLTGAQAGRARAQADAAAMDAERQQAQSEVAAMGAEISQMQAEQRYADQELARTQKLYKAGAVSLDELQSSTKDRDAAVARVKASEAKRKASERMAVAADKKAQAAKRAVDEASAMVAASRDEVTAVQARLDKARHELDNSSYEVSSLRAGAAAAKTVAGYRQLRALADGVVAERTVSPGTAVAMGQTVLKLKSMGVVRIQADLPQSLLGVAKEGAPIVVEVGNQSRAARITSVFPTVDEGSRTFRLEARVPNRDGLFASGMFAKMRVSTADSRMGPAVSSSAVLTDADGSAYVWVLGERAGEAKTDWTCTMHPEVSEPGPGKCPKCGMDLVPRERSGKYFAEKRRVEVGASDGRFTAATSGLKAGEKVIWAGHTDLQPGMAVQPTAWGTDGPSQLPQGGGGMEAMPGMDVPKKKGSGTRGQGPGVMDGNRPSSGSDTRSRPHHNAVAAAYVCPMKCRGSASAKPGDCPVCGMKLERISAAAVVHGS